MKTAHTTAPAQPRKLGFTPPPPKPAAPITPATPAAQPRKERKPEDGGRKSDG